MYSVGYPPEELRHPGVVGENPIAACALVKNSGLSTLSIKQLSSDSGEGIFRIMCFNVKACCRPTHPYVTAIRSKESTMKKTIPIVIGTVGVMLALAACSGTSTSSQPGGKVTLSIWTGFTGGDRPGYAQIVKDFNA